MKYLGYVMEAVIAIVFCWWIFCQQQQTEVRLEREFQQQVQPPVYYPQVIQATPQYRDYKY